MSGESQLGALITAMITPFDAAGKLNEASTRRLLHHLVEHGSDGVVVAGTTGESATLTDEEKLRLVEIAVEEIGKSASVIAGTGSNDTAHSVELTRQAAERGADAALVVTPYYNKPNRAGLVAHFEAVAAAADIPVILYNIPGRCVINLEPDLQSELAEIANVVAVKQANADIEQARQIIEDGKLSLYAGDDNILRQFSAIGGMGGICVTSHIFGEQMKEIHEAAHSGDSGRAAEIDNSLHDVYETLFMTSNPIATKAALNLLGFDVGGLRLPLVEASKTEQEGVCEMLERHGLLAPVAHS